MKKPRWIKTLILIAIIALAGCGGRAVEIRPDGAPPDAAPPDVASTPQPTLPPSSPGKTIVADGALAAPYPSLSLPFDSGVSGLLLTITVKAGDVVQAGDLLAILDDTDLQRAADDAQIDYDRAALNREQTIAQSDVNVRLAQLDLASAREGANDAELAAAYASVRDARVELDVAQHAYSSTLNSNYDGIARSRKIEFDWYVGNYQKQKARYERGEIDQSDHDHAMNAMITAEGRLNEVLEQARVEEIQTENRVAQANSALYQAWKELELVQSGPLTETVLRAELSVDLALVDRERARADLTDAERSLTQAQEALEHTQLFAPWAAIVLSVNVAPEVNIGAGAPVVTLLSIEDGLRFVTQNLSEQHIADIYPGQWAVVTLRTFPETPLDGTVEAVIPQTEGAVDTDARFTVHVRLDSTDLRLLPGLTGRMEIHIEE